MDAAERDTLVALIECGPLWDGDVPSKSGRDRLIEAGLAVRVVVGGEDGLTAATYAGGAAYKNLYPGPETAASTLREARLNRALLRVLRRMPLPPPPQA